MINDFDNLYNAIESKGCTPYTIKLLTNLTTNIIRGTIKIDRLNTAEHDGLRTAGANLIWASIIAGYARRSITTGKNVGARQDAFTINSLVDPLQEKLIEQYAKALGVWFENSEQWIISTYGEKIAQGAEAKVYYSSGDTSVIKERASIHKLCSSCYKS